MADRSRSFRVPACGKGVWQWAALLYLGSLVCGEASELPRDIWNGAHGGFPSITANGSGVSVTLPEQAITDAGGGSLASLIEDFLDRWAPEFCSDLFDFQHPRKKMTLRAAVHAAGGGAANYQEVVIDYQPSREVKCVEPDNLLY